jgi:hypothetical protein
MKVDTPILIIIYKRSHLLAQVLDVLRLVRPTTLYIAADGPRSEEEQVKCHQTRALIDTINWDCQVHRLFHEHNVGVRDAVSGAINWLFQHEEKGIILEEDCLPSQSFFPFCQEMLTRYEQDTRVMQVSGFNLLEQYTQQLPESYFFSDLAVNWGWATWRRAWQHYDLQLSTWKQQPQHPDFRSLYQRQATDDFFRWRWNNIVAGKLPDSCLFQWDFARKINSGLNIFPKVNLVRNIGFGADVSHAEFKKPANWLLRYQNQELEFPLRHKSWVIKNSALDFLYEQKFFKKPWYLKLLKRLQEVF